MNKPFDTYLGRNPALYGRDIVKALDIKHPPVDENQIADFLGYEIKEIGSEETSKWPGIWKLFHIAFAHLFKRENLILLNREVTPVRRRLGAFHEFGHDLLPWHTSLDFACSDTAITPIFHQFIEKEAFACGSEIMMPGDLFIPDILSLPLSISAIKALASRYDASLEATAIRYARINPSICSLVIAEPAENQKSQYIDHFHSSPGQLIFPFKIPSTQVRLEDEKKYPLKVKYSVKSHRFPKFIRPGTGIEEGNPIFEAWDSGRPVQAEIPASVFGSSAKWLYNAECLPLGKSGMVLVLLWLPDHQAKLDFENGVIS